MEDPKVIISGYVVTVKSFSEDQSRLLYGVSYDYRGPSVHTVKFLNSHCTAHFSYETVCVVCVVLVYLT